MSEALVQIEGTQPEEPDAYDWSALVDQLDRLLRLRGTPIGISVWDAKRYRDPGTVRQYCGLILRGLRRLRLVWGLRRAH